MASNPLFRLPVELQCMVISDLYKHDLLKLRATCRHFNKLCLPHILRRVVDEMNSQVFRRCYLHKAAEHCLHDLMLLLLNFQPPLGKVDTSGETSLHIAARRNCRECVRTLFLAGADPSALSGQGWTPLMVAARYGHDDAIEELVRVGADSNAQGFHGWTALHLARRFGHQKAVLHLIRAGADVDLPDCDGVKAGEECGWIKCWGATSALT